MRKRLRAIIHEIDLAEGRWLDAVRHFHTAIEVDECMRCWLDPMAHAFEMAGMPDSAIAYSRLLLDTPSAFGIMEDRLDHVRALERLGRLHEARGEREAALRAWARITQVWRNADPELQPRVRAAQERVRLLTDG